MKLKDQLKRQKKKAKQYLKNWAKTGSYSPALKRHVHITGLVWKHTIRSEQSRHPEDLLRRLKAIPKAKTILEKIKTIHEVRKTNNFQYWALEGIIKGKTTRVVIVGKPQKKLELFSIIAIKKEASSA